ncbi:MAG: L,D-transpeptidase [Acidobacteriota bacterium]
MNARPPDENPQPLAPRRRVWPVVLVIVAALVALVCGTGLVIARMGRPFLTSAFTITPSPEALVRDPASLHRSAAKAEATIDRVKPKGVIIMVDTFRSQLRMYKDGELVRKAICSTGTGRVLRDPRSGRQWVFDTPLGERVIHEKRRNPVWAKPDWAFIEDGYLPPPAGSQDRFDDASLGDYGLYMGDGYIIHGTLFKTLLGRRVTHGCIRLGDQDLEFVYKNAPIGSHVYLY